MSISFLHLMREVFPNITEETQRKLHQLIRRKDLYSNWLFSNRTLDYLCQGDVVEKLRVVITKTENKMLRKDLSVVLLSNTCDMQVDNGDPRSQYISIVPLLPCTDYLKYFEHILDYSRNIKENAITDKFYVSCPPGYDDDYIVDLSMISSVDTRYLIDGLKDGTITKKASLSGNGYYFFLAKLTLHLMRPESEEIEREGLSVIAN